MSYGILLIGLFVHAVLLVSIFDIYYSSPLIQGLPPHGVKSTEPPAKRVVVFSADGLRLRSFTSHPERSPYIHGLINNRTAISAIGNSHVPTESRPGHVAIFAGFTEDVSAVAHGWKKNPVPFDSVFNRSRESWIFGSPDITTLFDDIPHVHTASYSDSHEDFSSAKAHLMDEWVFEEVDKLLKSAEEEVGLSMRLKSDKVILFLHLLGIDTNGHGYNPESEKYLSNIRVVDDGIRRIQQAMDSFYGDDRTAYIFVSDHGMTDWGSHGAGSDDEVLVPFVAWGAGIKHGGPRKNIAQVDTTPLISSLLGIPIPTNSLGVLPVHILNTAPKYEYLSVMANFYQLREQLLHLRSAKSTRFFFQEYENFNSKSLSALEEHLNKLAKLGRYSAAASLFSDNSALIKQAIFYYHRYDRAFLGAAVSASFIGWILLLYCHLVNPDVKLNYSSLLLPNACFFCLLGLTVLLCLYYKFTISCSIYVLLPVYLFALVENVSHLSSRSVVYLHEIRNVPSIAALNQIAQPFIMFNVAAVFLCVFILTFLDRRWLSLVFGLLTLLPLAYESAVVNELSLYWRLFCLSLLPFPFLPAVGRSEVPFLCVAVPFTSSFCLWLASKRLKTLQPNAKLMQKIAIAHFVCAAFILLQMLLFRKPPLLCRLIAWLTIPTAFIAPLFTDGNLSRRVAAFVGSLLIPFFLLSIAYESLFMLLFLPLLLLFIRFEFSNLSLLELIHLPLPLPSDKNDRLSLSDFRRALVCICFVLCSLFGTGNFASFNSFSPSTLRRFVSVFSPFTMAALLVMRLLIPILISTVSIACAARLNAHVIRRVSCVTLICTDLMAMSFFYLLRDDGSWLEIGLSISHYVVSISMSVSIFLMLSLATFLVNFSLSSRSLSPIRQLFAGSKTDELL